MNFVDIEINQIVRTLKPGNSRITSIVLSPFGLEYTVGFTTDTGTIGVVAYGSSNGELKKNVGFNDYFGSLASIENRLISGSSGELGGVIDSWSAQMGLLFKGM